MNLPQQGEYIDIHSHHAKPVKGIFTVENIMAHENLQPYDVQSFGQAATYNLS